MFFSKKVCLTCFNQSCLLLVITSSRHLPLLIPHLLISNVYYTYLHKDQIKVAWFGVVCVVIMYYSMFNSLQLHLFYFCTLTSPHSTVAYPRPPPFGSTFIPSSSIVFKSNSLSSINPYVQNPN